MFWPACKLETTSGSKESGGREGGREGGRREGRVGGAGVHRSGGAHAGGGLSQA